MLNPGKEAGRNMVSARLTRAQGLPYAKTSEHRSQCQRRYRYPRGPSDAAMNHANQRRANHHCNQANALIYAKALVKQ